MRRGPAPGARPERRCCVLLISWARNVDHGKSRRCNVVVKPFATAVARALPGGGRTLSRSGPRAEQRCQRLEPDLGHLIVAALREVQPVGGELTRSPDPRSQV